MSNATDQATGVASADDVLKTTRFLYAYGGGEFKKVSGKPDLAQYKTDDPHAQDRYVAKGRKRFQKALERGLIILPVLLVVAEFLTWLPSPSACPEQLLIPLTHRGTDLRTDALERARVVREVAGAQRLDPGGVVAVEGRLRRGATGLGRIGRRVEPHAEVEGVDRCERRIL
jgi:hypothetical protein